MQSLFIENSLYILCLGHQKNPLGLRRFLSIDLSLQCPIFDIVSTFADKFICSCLILLFRLVFTDRECLCCFFFFSYNCSGMNFKDIANLTYGQVDGNRLKFFRKKTENTTSEQTEISVYLTPFAHYVINKYGSPDKSSGMLIFDIIRKDMSAVDKQKAVKNFTRSVNQGLKKLAKKVGIDENISTYYARHSFSTNAIRSGASMELVSEQLGHSNLKTTQNYFSGFEDDSIEDLTKKLMTF